jgi:hypothetical protein
MDDYEGTIEMVGDGLISIFFHMTIDDYLATIQ